MPVGWGFVDVLEAGERAVRADVDPMTFGIFTHLCLASRTTGNRVPDAMLASLAVRHGATLVNADRAFSLRHASPAMPPAGPYGMMPSRTFKRRSRMLRNLNVNRILWIVLACLSLTAAGIGMLRQDIYGSVVTNDWLPGIVSQDAITILAALILLALAVAVTDGHRKLQIVALSLLPYLFYAYGIYVIERLYTSLYLLFMAIFGLSFWSMVYGAMSIDVDALRDAGMSKAVKVLSIVDLFFTAVLFYALWTGRLIPMMQTGEKAEFGYSIFILDMAFVMPAIVISAALLIRKHPVGLVLAPVLFLKAFTLLFSVGLGGLLKPLYHQEIAAGETAFYLVLSVVYLALAVACIASLRIPHRRAT